MEVKRAYQLTGVVIGLAVAVIGLSAFGASGSSTVSGRVTFQGRPVVWGAVILVGPDGRSAVGRIETDGNFTVANAPTGDVGVSITSPDPLVQHYATQLKSARDRIPVALWAAPPVDRQQWFVLPARYENAKTSDLKLAVKRGTNRDCNFDLLP